MASYHDIHARYMEFMEGIAPGYRFTDGETIFSTFEEGITAVLKLIVNDIYETAMGDVEGITAEEQTAAKGILNSKLRDYL